MITGPPANRKCPGTLWLLSVRVRGSQQLLEIRMIKTRVIMAFHDMGAEEEEAAASAAVAGTGALTEAVVTAEDAGAVQNPRGACRITQ